MAVRVLVYAVAALNDSSLAVATARGSETPGEIGGAGWPAVTAPRRTR